MYGIFDQAPQLDINTVAAGGGSQLFFHSGMFVVGPESAGAHPGPVCYKKGKSFQINLVYLTTVEFSVLIPEIMRLCLISTNGCRWTAGCH